MCYNFFCLTLNMEYLSLHPAYLVRLLALKLKLNVDFIEAA